MQLFTTLETIHNAVLVEVCVKCAFDFVVIEAIQF